MDLEQAAIFLLIGGIAGWLAGHLLKGRSFGILGNIIIGVLGAFLGGGLFALLDISIGIRIIGPIITATVGAMVLLIALRFLKKT